MFINSIQIHILPSNSFMKKSLIVFWLLILNLNSIGQDIQIKYLNLVNYGEYLKYIGEYSKSLNVYQKAFKLDVKMQGKDFLATAHLCFRLKKEDEAIKYLILAAHYPIGFNKLIIQKDSFLFEELNKSESLKQIYEKTIKENEEIRNAFMDSSFRIKNKEISNWVDSDQYYTKLRSEYWAKTVVGSEKRRIQQNEDSMFYERYYNYILKNGYPGFWISNTDILQTVNVHIFAGDQGMRFKKLLYSEYLKGNMLTDEFAYFLDRNEFWTNQKCGLALYSGEFCFIDKDWKIIAENRLKYGMSIFFKGPRRIYNRDMNPSKLLNYIDLGQLSSWFE